MILSISLRKKDFPVEPESNAKTIFVFSDVYGNNEKIQNGLIFTGDFKTGENRPPSVAIIALSGILYYRVVKGAYDEFSVGML